MRFLIVVAAGAYAIAMVQWLTGDGGKRARISAWAAFSVGLIATTLALAFKFLGWLR